MPGDVSSAVKRLFALLLFFSSFFTMDNRVIEVHTRLMNLVETRIIIKAAYPYSPLK